MTPKEFDAIYRELRVLSYKYSVYLTFEHKDYFRDDIGLIIERCERLIEKEKTQE